MGFGEQFLSGGGLPDATAFQKAADLRLGSQVNDWLGLYGQLHMSLGNGLGTPAYGGQFEGVTGVVAATFMADFTFLSRLFLGVGGGIGTELLGPLGSCIEARLGGYPFLQRNDEGPRRFGVTVAVDVRIIFFTGVTSVEAVGSVGFEFF
jgi:hypothetical protein